jgi:hypothetical protein
MRAGTGITIGVGRGVYGIAIKYAAIDAAAIKCNIRINLKK